jgi:hypothetical protein
MPYCLKRVSRGYKVCKKNSPKCFSKKPLTKKIAKNQLKALYASEKANESLTNFEQVYNSIMSK